MRKMMIIALGLTLFPSALIPIRPNIQPRAELVRRFYRSGDFIAVAQEAALDLKSHASGPDDMVAIRICSRSPMPLALSKSGISPFYMLPYLEHYGFTPDRISFLRSEDCLNDDHTITATEFWAVPKGATPPSSSE